MNDILRGLKIVLAAAAVLAVLSGLVTVIVAGLGVLFALVCRLVPILLSLALVVGVLWLIGRMTRRWGN